jgi:uncharacterized protein
MGLSFSPMSEQPLLVHVSQIPPEGQDLDAALDAGTVHLEGQEDFELLPGGRFKGRVERGEENSVHVRGRVTSRLRMQCGRCLEAFERPVDADLDLFFLPRGKDTEAREEEDDVELSDHDMVVAYYDGDRLDIGEMVREQLFLDLPLRRVCRDECKGLCPVCGGNRNVKDCGCPEPATADPRLAVLGKLFDKGS